MGSIILAVKSFVELINVIRQALELYQKAKLEGWLEAGKEILDKIKNAKSDEERAKLVKDLNGHYHP